MLSKRVPLLNSEDKRMTQERSNGFGIDGRECRKVHWGPHRYPRLLSEEWLKDEIWRCHGNGPRAMSDKEEELLEKLLGHMDPCVSWDLNHESWDLQAGVS